MKHKPVVLIVDDSTTGRRSIEGVLDHNTYDMFFASDGYEALHIAEVETPDIILLDVLMPGIDGFEVCRRLRQTPRLEAVPIIMITAMDDRASKIQGIEAGADDFVTKPFDRTLLRTRVQTITRLNRYRRLVKERTRFEWVVQHAEDGYIILSQRDEIQYMNSRAAHFLGSEFASRVIGERMFPLIKGRFNCEPMDMWENWPKCLVENPNALRFLVKPESHNDHVQWLQVGCLDVPTNDFDPLVLIIRDVSNTINEQRLTWSFHGMMSHKMRTPLNIIKSSIELFNVDELSEENKNIFRMLKDGACRLDGELTEILDFIDAPIKAHTLDSVNLESISEIIQQVSKHQDIANYDLFHQEIPEDCQIPISHKAFRAIITELFGNSKKFHPRRSPSVSIHLTTNIEGYLNIKIIDDGVHITHNTQRNAFIPYYQGEKFFTGQLEGMGLGLSMVASILWEVNGRFEIKNRHDQPGVEVNLVVPLEHTAVVKEV